MGKKLSVLVAPDALPLAVAACEHPKEETYSLKATEDILDIPLLLSVQNGKTSGHSNPTSSPAMGMLPKLRSLESFQMEWTFKGYLV